MSVTDLLLDTPMSWLVGCFCYTSDTYKYARTSACSCVGQAFLFLVQKICQLIWPMLLYGLYQIAAALAPMLMRPVKGILAGVLVVDSYAHTGSLSFQHTLTIHLVAAQASAILMNVPCAGKMDVCAYVTPRCAPLSGSRPCSCDLDDTWHSWFVMLPDTTTKNIPCSWHVSVAA